MDNLQTQISELLNEKRISVLRGQKSMHQIFSNLICQIHDVDEDAVIDSMVFHEIEEAIVRTIENFEL
jgi:hypothetical protein